VTTTTVLRLHAEEPAPVGTLLRGWRERRRLSQLDLALRAEVSTRHLSFVETGRSRPTSEMILRLAQQLDVPLRERNVLLLSGGYAPAYPANALADPPMSAVHEAIEHVLRAALRSRTVYAPRGFAHRRSPSQGSTSRSPEISPWVQVPGPAAAGRRPRHGRVRCAG
jgi:transcriptional regulator with XRE-family HTH domain